MKNAEFIDGNKLRHIREAIDLGPVQMAKAMNTTYGTYKDWENGSRSGVNGKRIVGRRPLKGAALRCVQMLRMYPKTAKKLAQAES